MQLTKPTILIDKAQAIRNIRKMAEKAKKSGIKFRPHFKTHISAEIGNWFKEFDVSSIAVSSIDMAEYFADNGWDDIMVAVAFNIHQLTQLKALSNSNTMDVLVDSIETTDFLGVNFNGRVKVWIEIDIGYGRTGIPFDDLNYINAVAKRISKYSSLQLTGILTHAGHMYHAESIEEIKEIYHDQVKKMNSVKESLSSEGFTEIKILVGDTPTCSVIERFDQSIHDIRPGNFVFYDLAQHFVGSCTEDDKKSTLLK